MTECGEPTVGLTLRPGTLAGPVVVVVADVGVVAVVAVVGVVAVGGAPPGALVAVLVVCELCAQPARASAGATPARMAAATPRRRRTWRLIGTAPRSAGSVHERAQLSLGAAHDGVAVGEQQAVEVQLQQAAIRGP